MDTPFNYISFDDPDERQRFQRSAVTILESISTPLVLLDEVQKIPALFDPLKLVIDRERKKPADVVQVANIDIFAQAQKLLCARTANLFVVSEAARDLGVAVNMDFF